MLVALAIVGLMLGATASVFGNGLLGNAAAENVNTALTVAEEKLAAIGVTETLRPRQTQGIFAERFAWRLAVAPFDDKPASPAESSTAADSVALRLFRIDVSVAWREGLRARQVALTTLRLAPAPR